MFLLTIAQHFIPKCVKTYSVYGRVQAHNTQLATLPHSLNFMLYRVYTHTNAHKRTHILVSSFLKTSEVA